VTRALAAVLAPALLLLGGVSSGQPAGSGAPPGELQFERLNRSYSQVAPELLPITEGPVTVRLSSPQNSLTVRSHLLRLEPGAGNSHTADLHIEFSGKGWLVADVEMAGVSTRLEAAVVVPEQTLEMQGRLRLRKVSGGYEVTPEQLPRQVVIRIESDIGRRLVDLCDGVSQLPFTAVDCTALERALSRAAVPLPAPGESFVLADAELTPRDRQRLDLYLKSSAQGGAR
jgi:hypothetical protein